jgi:hypothetical protein
VDRALGDRVTLSYYTKSDQRAGLESSISNPGGRCLDN